MGIHTHTCHCDIVTVYIRHHIIVAEGHNYMMPNIYSHYVTMACMCVYVKVCVCVGMCYNTYPHTHTLLHTHTHTCHCDIVTVYIRHHIIVAFCHNKLCWTSYNCDLLPQQTGVASPCN